MFTHYTLADGMLLTQTRSGTASYYLTDAQGSTRLLTNASGTVSDTYAYTAFGELRHQTGTTPNAYRYTGQQFDALTGLYSLRARYYAPSAGRFLSADMWPASLDRTSTYSYAFNNPVTLDDPSGYSPLIENVEVETPQTTTSIGAIRAAGYRFYGWLTRVFVDTQLLLMRQHIVLCVLVDILTGFPAIDLGCGAGLPANVDIDPDPDYPPFGLKIFERIRIDLAPTQHPYDPNTPFQPHPLFSVNTANFGGETTANGGHRNPRVFWKEWLRMEDFRSVPTLSENNIKLIKDKQAPKVDDLCIFSFPEHSGAMGGEIIHHHVEQGPLAIPVPDLYHRYAPYFGTWHN